MSSTVLKINKQKSGNISQPPKFPKEEMGPEKVQKSSLQSTTRTFNIPGKRFILE